MSWPSHHGFAAVRLRQEVDGISIEVDVRGRGQARGEGRRLLSLQSRPRDDARCHVAPEQIAAVCCEPRPNTERQYREAIASAGLLDGPPETLPSLEELRAAVESVRPPVRPPQQLSSLDRYRPMIVALSDKGLGPRAIFDRLRLEHPEFAESHSAVKRLFRAIQRARGVQAQDVAIPVETAPRRDRSRQTRSRRPCNVIAAQPNEHVAQATASAATR